MPASSLDTIHDKIMAFKEAQQLVKRTMISYWKRTEQETAWIKISHYIVSAQNFRKDKTCESKGQRN